MYLLVDIREGALQNKIAEVYSGHPHEQPVVEALLGEAFASVNFPILPFAERIGANSFKLYKRNTRLYTPRDFDYSPYFDIIKYPYLDLDDVAAYRALPWDEEGMVCNAHGDCYIPYQKKNAEGVPDATEEDTTKEADEVENYSEKP